MQLNTEIIAKNLKAKNKRVLPLPNNIIWVQRKIIAYNHYKIKSKIKDFSKMELRSPTLSI